MKKTVFLRSTIRQPVHSLFLLLLVGVISFAFVARVEEYSLISQEQEQLAAYYRSIGTLASSQESEGTASLDKVMDYLKQAPYVSYTDHRIYTSGVIQDGYQNADFEPDGIVWRSSDRINFDRILPWDVYFYGTYTGVEFDAPMKEGQSAFPFTVDEVVSGYPELITPGMSVSLWIDWETFRGDCTKLERGGRYLLCAGKRYISLDYDRLSNRTDFEWFSLGSTTGWFLPASENLDLSLPE
ncbi:MAG: hypothetical protein J6J87_06615, partial [Oscillospiraceae bacterium]|nr:hypothetical protein [Oscillospiraceae bacterium]